MKSKYLLLGICLGITIETMGLYLWYMISNNQPQNSTTLKIEQSKKKRELSVLSRSKRNQKRRLRSQNNSSQREQPQKKIYTIPIPPSFETTTNINYGWWRLGKSNRNQKIETNSFQFSGSGVLTYNYSTKDKQLTHLEFLPSYKSRRLPVNHRLPPHPKNQVSNDEESQPQLTLTFICSSSQTSDNDFHYIWQRKDLDNISESITLPLPECSQKGQVVITVKQKPSDKFYITDFNVFSATSSPNRVILISLDTHALMHMNISQANSVDTNPVLQNLIYCNKDSLMYTGGYGASYWTLPSHATMFTGVYPSQHGLYKSKPITALDPSLKTLYELLPSQNVKKFHLASHTRLDSRYGYYRGVNYYKLYKEKLGKRGKQVIKNAVSLLKQSSQRDVFMFLHLFDAHSPYTNYPHSYKKLPLPEKPYYPSKEIYQNAAYKQNILKNNGWLPEKRLENIETYTEKYSQLLAQAKVAYQLGLKHVDSMLKDLFLSLKQADLFDNTTIIITSDHGEEFFDHGLLTHTSLYNENILIPFIIKLPKLEPEFSNQNLLKINPYHFEAHTTIFKIILDLFNQHIPAYINNSLSNSLSLTELLNLHKHQPVFSEMIMQPGSNYYEVASIADNVKTIISFNNYSNKNNILKPTYIQQYDLTDDPFEKENIYDSATDIVTPAILKITEKAKTLKKSSFKNLKTSSFSNQEIERLKQLGYIMEN